jgi:hypothetical protein
VKAERQTSVRLVVRKEGYAPAEYTATLGNTALGVVLTKPAP